MKKVVLLLILVIGMTVAYEYYQKVVYYDINYTTQIVKQTTWKESKITDNVYYATPVVTITKEYIPVVTKTTYTRQTYIPESKYITKTYYPVHHKKRCNYYPYSTVYYNYNTYSQPTTTVINGDNTVQYYYNDGSIIIIK